ncbi:MAG TPA: plastocyanin/azurin family copper-binding protein [Frankiaceae bacterium]|nr:plastocyanin/azurin family copper-binding protein [Frankiaceae bacterium]
MSRIGSFAAVALLAVTACGGDGGTESAEGPVRTDRVTAAKSYTFSPAEIAVSPGTTVTWTNDDDFPHDVTLLDGSKEKHALSIGRSATITFADAGTFRYQCSIHPQQMRGSVVVG